jgi:hypothetical protein
VRAKSFSPTLALLLLRCLLPSLARADGDANRREPPARTTHVVRRTVLDTSPIRPSPAAIERRVEEQEELPSEPPVPEDGAAPRRPGPPAIPEAAAPEGGDLAPLPLAPNTINLFQNTSLMAVPSAGNLSAVSEPSTAEGGANVFFTSNWFAARSTNGGASFSLVNPYSTFPSANGGFCCDQDTIYDAGHGLFVWLLQYVNDANGNIDRLAYTTNPAGAWSYVDLKPEDISGGGIFVNSDWFDFPHLTVGTNDLYITTNVFTNGGAFRAAQIIRVSLAQLAAGSGIVVTDRYYSTSPALYAPAQGTAGTVYFFGHASTSTLRVFSWPEGGAVASTDVPHASYIQSAGSYSCVDTDGFDACAFESSRPMAAWVSGGKIGVLWQAGKGTDGLGTFTYPYVKILVLNEATKALQADTALYSNDRAWFYPSAAPNGAGTVGGTVGWAGGSYKPSCGVWISDANSGASPAGFPMQVMQVAASTHNTSRNRWGDFLRARKSTTSAEQWVGTCYTLQGGNTNGFAEPRYLRFGRDPSACAADATAPVVTAPSAVTTPQTLCP